MSLNWPSTGSTYWKSPVANVASLPVGANAGEIRCTLDTLNLYEYSGSAWQKITSSSADVAGPSSSIDSELAIYSGTTGKLIKRATGTGFVKVVSGVMQSPSSTVALTSEVSGILPVANGGTNSNTALNNNRIMQSSGGKIQEAAAITPSKVLVSDANGIPVAATPSTTEINYVAGVTSLIQTQLDAKLALAGGTMIGDLTLAGDPNAALKAATKQYVDSVAAGLDVKPSVICATTANITLSGEQTLDGILTSASRVLVKNQNAPAQNGIYVSAAGAWTRATDMDAWIEVPGAFCFVETGTLYADTAWVCSANAGGTIGSTSITWSQFAGAGTYTADGQGIELTGTQFSLELDGSTLSKSASGVKVADLGIADAQIAAAAAITRTKMASGTNYRILANTSAGVMGENAAITGSKVIVSDANGQLVAATTSTTEVNYVAGVTSLIQTQLDAKLCATSIAAVSSNITLTNLRIHLVDTSSARSLALPAPSTSIFIVIKDKTGSCSTNNITITRFASEKIETVAGSYVLDADLGSWTIVSDGTDFFVI